jgi:hypothetical protein
MASHEKFQAKLLIRISARYIAPILLVDMYRYRRSSSWRDDDTISCKLFWQVGGSSGSSTNKDGDINGFTASRGKVESSF